MQKRRNNMGYRSDVAYTIRFKKPEHMALFISEAKSKDYGEGALRECMIDEVKLQINFSAESAKWYESYPDVQVHENLIQQAKDWCESDEHEHTRQTGDTTYMGQGAYKLGFIFTRIGENTDDVQEDFGGEYDWDWIGVSRHIITDWD
jgi:hypothetical protein